VGGSGVSSWREHWEEGMSSGRNIARSRGRPLGDRRRSSDGISGWSCGKRGATVRGAEEQWEERRSSGRIKEKEQLDEQWGEQWEEGRSNERSSGRSGGRSSGRISWRSSQRNSVRSSGRSSGSSSWRSSRGWEE
jgi:hypothetical protein